MSTGLNGYDDNGIFNTGIEETDSDLSSAKSKRKRSMPSEFRTGLVYFVCGAAFSLIVLAAILLITDSSIITGEKAEYYEALYESFGKYYEMKVKIEENSIYGLDEDLLDTALSTALVASITDDDYAYYYTASAYESYKNSELSESYAGIGVAIVSDDDGNIVVTRVIEGGPAEEAGIQAGDVITAVDGTEPESTSEASSLISGTTGTKVALTIERDGSTYEYTLVRAEISESSVSYSVYDSSKGIGYISISSFKSGTADNFEDAIDALKEEGCTDIIIDLRGNPGGLQTEAEECADIILPAAVIMTVEDKDGNVTTYTSDDSNAEVNCVVVIDSSTASAAELFAAALGYQDDIYIVGETSYGKGIIQSIYEMSDGSAFKFTIGEYFAPDGSAINGVGVTPDIEGGDDPLATAAALF